MVSAVIPRASCCNNFGPESERRYGGYGEPLRKFNAADDDTVAVPVSANGSYRSVARKVRSWTSSPSRCTATTDPRSRLAIHVSPG